MQAIKWYEKTWVILLSLLLFPPLGFYLILRSSRHKTHIKIIFVIVFLIFLLVVIFLGITGIPLYYSDYSRIVSSYPLQSPQDVEDTEFREGKIYLVPIGIVDESFLKELIPYIEERFHYRVAIGEPLELSKPATRSYSWAYSLTLTQKLGKKYPIPPDAVRCIGITNWDLTNWNVIRKYEVVRGKEHLINPLLNQELYFLSRNYPYMPKEIYYMFYHTLVYSKVGARAFELSHVYAPGKVGVVSLYRLREPMFFWKSHEILLRRAVNDITFRLGQSFGFTDCPHKYCVMRHHNDSVYFLDEKRTELCFSCKMRFEALLKFYDYLLFNKLGEIEQSACQEIEKDPEDVISHTLLGLVNKEKGEYEKAEKEIRRALEIFPENETALYIFGEIYHDLANKRIETIVPLKEYLAKDADELFTYAKRRLILEPEQVLYRGLLAFAYFKLEKYIEAEKEIEKIEELPVWIKELRLAINEMNWAKEKYKDAVKINRIFPSIFYNFALDFKRKGEFDKAILFYKQAIRIKEKAPCYHANLGWAYWHKKMYPQAIRAFKKTIKLDPNHKAAYNGLGKSYASLEDFEKAKSYLVEAIRLDQGNACAYFTLGLVHEEKGNYMEALRLYRLSLSMRYAGGYTDERGTGHDLQGNFIYLEERIKEISEKIS